MLPLYVLLGGRYLRSTPRWALETKSAGGGYAPTASDRHFFVKLVLAAPANFLSPAAISQAEVPVDLCREKIKQKPQRSRCRRLELCP
jgi:hypothetical protein